MQTNCASWKGKQKRDTLERMSPYPANCASECIRPIVSVIPYQAGLAAIFDFLCTTFEIIMN